MYEIALIGAFYVHIKAHSCKGNLCHSLIYMTDMYLNVNSVVLWYSMWSFEIIARLVAKVTTITHMPLNTQELLSRWPVNKYRQNLGGWKKWNFVMVAQYHQTTHVQRAQFLTVSHQYRNAWNVTGKLKK